MKVSGTLSARAIEVSGGTVLTTKDISSIQSKVLEQVGKSRSLALPGLGEHGLTNQAGKS